MIKKTSTFLQLRNASKMIFGDYGEFLYNEWDAHNKKYFREQLKVPAIQCGLTPHGRTLGYYMPEYNVITIHWSLMPARKHFSKTTNPRPWGLKPKKQVASDVMLHEMIHQLLHQTGKYAVGDDAHFCKAWIDEVARLAPMLGFANYHFSMFKRTKVRGSRKNVYVPVTELPVGKKLASRDFIKCFPLLK